MPLILLPNVLGPSGTLDLLPATLPLLVSKLDGLFAENEKEGRRFLKRFTLKKKLQEMEIVALNEHTQMEDLEPYLNRLSNELWGVVSDAGLPCLADPGSLLVSAAKIRKISIQALSGPSSVTLALMLSGQKSQRFSFHGYIAKDPLNRKKELKKWEEESRKERMTQIFIETPYRNDYLLKDCIDTLADTTLFSICSNLTEPEEKVLTFPISFWKKYPLPSLKDIPTIFLFSA